MPTQVVTWKTTSGPSAREKEFATRGIDAGDFQAENPISNVQIISRLGRVHSLLVGPLLSSGAAPAAEAISVSIYNTSLSAGAFIPSGELTVGANYQWLAVGLG